MFADQWGLYPNDKCVAIRDCDRKLIHYFSCNTIKFSRVIVCQYVIVARISALGMHFQ